MGRGVKKLTVITEKMITTPRIHSIFPVIKTALGYSSLVFLTVQSHQGAYLAPGLTWRGPVLRTPQSDYRNSKGWLLGHVPSSCSQYAHSPTPDHFAFKPNTAYAVAYCQATALYRNSKATVLLQKKVFDRGHCPTSSPSVKHML